MPLPFDQLLSTLPTATIHRDCKYLSTTVTVQLGAESFSVCGAQVIDPGFTEVMDWLAVGRSEALPEVKQGDTLEVKSVSVLASA